MSHTDTLNNTLSCTPVEERAKITRRLHELEDQGVLTLAVECPGEYWVCHSPELGGNVLTSMEEAQAFLDAHD